MLALVFGVGAIALIRDTVYQGQDFDVFWHAARHLLASEPVYNLTRDGAMVFKYPPWALPAFVPFALLPLSWAKWVWGAVEVASLAAVARWLFRQGCRTASIAAVTLLFWGIWAVHALDGQVMLPILCGALWLSESDRSWPNAGIAWFLSLKIFPLVAMLGRGSSLRRGFVLFLIPVTFVTLSFPVWRAMPHSSARGLVTEWVGAAGSGGDRFAGGKVRGRDNQGLPALVLRRLVVPAGDTRADAVAFLGVAALLSGLWWFVQRKLGRQESWAGWLAVAAVAHPLAWVHGFVLVFPLAVMSLDRAVLVRQRARAPLFLALLGIALTAVITGKTCGSIGLAFELWSIKSFGAMFCAASLVWARGVQQRT